MSGQIDIGVTVRARDARGELASLKGSIDGVEQSTNRMAISQRQASQLITSNERASRRFIAALKEEAANYGKSRQEILAYKAAQMGVADEAAPYIAKMREMAVANRAVGDSSRYTEFQMRMMPAQISQTFSSIATGQPIMQVFLQQGHQVVDMFGGIRQAVAATGRFLLGLLTPINLLGAGVAAVGVAWYQAAHQQAAFAGALRLTSNYAGTTTGQMYRYAAAVSDATRQTVGATRTMAEQIAASGSVTATAYQSAIRAAAEYADATGKSAADSAKYVVQLFADPTNGALTLNKTMHLLTASQIEYIRRLQESGRYGEAQKQLADDLTARLSKMHAELSGLAAVWDTVKKAASAAWSAMGSGAGKTTASDIQRSIEQLQMMQKLNPTQNFAPQIAHLRQMQADLSKRNEDATRKAAVEAKNAVLEQARAQADAAYATRTTAGQVEKLNLEIEKYQRLLKEDPGHATVYNALIEVDKKRVAELTHAASGALSPARHPAAAAKAVTPPGSKEADAYIQSYQRVGDTIVKMTNDFGAFVDAQKASVAVLPASTRVLNSELAKVGLIADRARSQLKRAYDGGKISADQYREALTAVTQQEVRQREVTTAMHQQQERLNASWVHGARQGFQAYVDGLQNTAAMAKSVTEGMLTRVTDAFSTFVATGKLSFKDLADSIAADLARIAMRIEITQALKAASDTSWGGILSQFIKSADGNVFASPGLSAYSGTVVSSPTLFPFANGTGLMGEAGPEAILPLQRGSNGKLGVVAQAANDSASQKGAPAQHNEFHFHITTQDARSFDRAKGQIGSDMALALQRAQTRYG
jgi:phage-related minor tail protein